MCSVPFPADYDFTLFTQMQLSLNETICIISFTKKLSVHHLKGFMDAVLKVEYDINWLVTIKIPYIKQLSEYMPPRILNLTHLKIFG